MSYNENTEFLRISNAQGGILHEEIQQCKSTPTVSGVGGSGFEKNLRM